MDNPDLRRMWGSRNRDDPGMGRMDRHSTQEGERFRVRNVEDTGLDVGIQGKG